MKSPVPPYLNHRSLMIDFYYVYFINEKDLQKIFKKSELVGLQRLTCSTFLFGLLLIRYKGNELSHWVIRTLNLSFNPGCVNMKKKNHISWYILKWDKTISTSRLMFLQSMRAHLRIICCSRMPLKHIFWHSMSMLRVPCKMKITLIDIFNPVMQYLLRLLWMKGPKIQRKFCKFLIEGAFQNGCQNVLKWAKIPISGHNLD